MNKLNEIQQKISVPKNQRNTFGNYDYRSCEDILAEVKPLLGEATLTLTDDLVCIGERYYIKSTATLVDGDKVWFANGFAREDVEKKGMDLAQLTGSCSSYSRKYALNGLLLLDDVKDADTMDNREPVEIGKPTDF
jgi:hypothetical protein